MSDETVPLPDLLRDAAGILGDGDYPGLAQACQLAAIKLGGLPSREGESFVKDILAVLDAADAIDHDRGVEGDSVHALTEAAEQCRTWGLDPGKRLPNALRQVIESLDKIRTFAEQCAAKTLVECDGCNGDGILYDEGATETCAKCNGDGQVVAPQTVRNDLASISKACANLLDALGIAQPKLDG